MPSPASRIIVHLFLLVILLAGPILLTLAAVASAGNLIFICNAATTDGTILDLHGVDSSKDPDSYAPVFRFTADDGRTYIVVSNSSTAPPGFSVGEHVRVLYQKGRPESAKIDTLYQLWLSGTSPRNRWRSAQCDSRGLHPPPPEITAAALMPVP